MRTQSHLSTAPFAHLGYEKLEKRRSLRWLEGDGFLGLVEDEFRDAPEKTELKAHNHDRVAAYRQSFLFDRGVCVDVITEEKRGGGRT